MNIAKWLIEVTIGVVIGIIAAFILFNYVFFTAVVVSGSMEPTVMTGAYTLSNRLSYTFDDPERGDVAFFYSIDEPDTVFLKRVIGLPGDHVVVKGGSVYINGMKLDEPYLVTVMGTVRDGEWDVPECMYFMMGDNRNDSADSRVWQHPFVYREDFIAKAMVGYDTDNGMRMIE